MEEMNETTDFITYHNKLVDFFFSSSNFFLTENFISKFLEKEGSVFRKRCCWNCNKEIHIQDYILSIIEYIIDEKGIPMEDLYKNLEKGIKFDSCIELYSSLKEKLKLWNSSYVELYCCACMLTLLEDYEHIQQKKLWMSRFKFKKFL